MEKKKKTVWVMIDRFQDTEENLLESQWLLLLNVTSISAFLKASFICEEARLKLWKSLMNK